MSSSDAFTIVKAYRRKFDQRKFLVLAILRSTIRKIFNVIIRNVTSNETKF